MADETNIEKFNRFSGFFLERLYAHFPVPTDLDCHEAVYGMPLSGTGTDGAISNDDLQRASCDAEINFCAHALNWLQVTGYFRASHGRTHNIQFIQAVLTPKGFEALNAIPASLAPGQTLGQQLSSAVHDSVGDARRAVISQIVGQVIGAAVRGMFPPTP